ncbi:uncharacterized protein LOC118445175 [Vespa mandarinia]|uniref:uncharacterized protein LOC118445175 n=1 Tax=Vespa mandarinia TaxID=7446 RepID=UPI001613D9D0|nr:uncharacterized protein LOC118445175 [Vespa mandarinia]
MGERIRIGKWQYGGWGATNGVMISIDTTKMIENGDTFYLHNPYYKLHRHMYVIVGVWPYETGYWWQSVLYCLNFVLITFLIVGQIPIFFTIECTIETISEIFFIFGPTICTATIYYLINIIKKNQKELLDHIKNDWYNLKTIEEFSIIKEYAEGTRIYLLIMLFICFLPIVIKALLSTISLSIDSSLISNKTRREIYPYQFELFFINTEEHLYFRIFICSFLLMVLSTIGTINMGSFQLLMQHACAMFRIVGIILENAFNEERLSFRKYNEEAIFGTFYRVINSHNRMLQFDLDKTNLYKFFTTFFHMLCMTSIGILQSHIGQRLTNHSADFFQEI